MVLKSVYIGYWCCRLKKEFVGVVAEVMKVSSVASYIVNV